LKPRLAYQSPGRIILGPGRNKTYKPAGPALHKPGWAGKPSPPGWARASSRLGRGSQAWMGRHPALPQQPGWVGQSFPGWAGRPVPVGPALYPAWAPCSIPRLGLRVMPPWFPGWAGRPRLGRQVSSDWAGIPAPPASHAPVGWLPHRTRLGRIRRIRPDRDFFSRPSFGNPGWAGLVYSGWARPGFPWPRPDYPSPGRLSPSWAEIYLLRDILLIRHRLHCLMPVLGCL
jgi:hypothetical protein